MAQAMRKQPHRVRAVLRGAVPDNGAAAQRLVVQVKAERKAWARRAVAGNGADKVEASIRNRCSIAHP